MESSLNILKEAKRVLSIESESIANQIETLNEVFVEVINLIHSNKGRVIVSGIGKSAIIAQKMVATLNSTGTPSIFMHAADAIHGDLGIIQKEDVVILLSNSGNTPEIKALLPIIKMAGNPIIGICSNNTSKLAKDADYCILMAIKEEACPLDLAPTSSTTLQMAIGDAIAVCLLKLKGFSAHDFAKFHPGGSLGKKLYLTLGDIANYNQQPFVLKDASIEAVLMEITAKRLGATVVLEQNKVVGVITDGDIRRMLAGKKDWKNLKAEDIMSRNPLTLFDDTLAVKGREIISEKNISQLIIVDNNGDYKGMVHFHDLIKEGITSL